MKTILTFSFSLIFILCFNFCSKDERKEDIGIKFTTTAGSDITNINGIKVKLSADTLKTGESGKWSIAKGLIDKLVYFEDEKSPTTLFYGLPGQRYSLIWEVTNLEKKQAQDTVNVYFNPLVVKIEVERPENYSTRLFLNDSGGNKGLWILYGDYLRLQGANDSKEVKIYGKENSTFTAIRKVTYGSVSFSDTINIKTGEYTEYEALEDFQAINHPYRYKMENGHVTTIYLQGDEIGWVFGDFEYYPALKALKYLENLIITGSGLYKFANEIPKYYKNLKVIDLYGNFLDEIPENIGELKNLEVLRLGNQQGDHQITKIPDSFCKLIKLREFYYSVGNYTNTLPDSIGNLTNLEIFDIFGSSLESLPESFGNLKSLKLFFVSEIKSNIPESFGNLENLENFSMDMYSSHMTNLPASFGNLKKLKLLTIYGATDIQTLPENFGDLDSLQTLIWAGSLKQLPVSFGNLKNIKAIQIDGQLNTLPESFSNLKTLKGLIIKNTKTRSEFTLPQNIDGLSNLTGLYLNYMTTPQLPTSIGNLKSLEVLEMDHCALESLPGSIVTLSNLKKLRILANNLTSIPEDIGKLQNLQELNLSGNKLDSLPSSVKDLKHLITLNISDNVGLIWQIDIIKSWNRWIYFYY
jgi:Leucine-rich repeat (LRR) protein